MTAAQVAARPARGIPEETKQRLVVAAANTFEEHGYFGTDSNAIARSAGYSPGTFYKHFEDKTEAFLAAYAWWVETVWSGVDQVWSSERSGNRRSALEHVVEVHRAWPGLRRDLRHLASSEPRVRKAYLAQRKAQIERLRERGASREGAATLLYAVERTADGIADGEPKTLGLDVEALLDELLEIARRALR